MSLATISQRINQIKDRIYQIDHRFNQGFKKDFHQMLNKEIQNQEEKQNNIYKPWNRDLSNRHLPKLDLNKQNQKDFLENKYQDKIKDLASRYSVPTAMIHSVMMVESANDPGAVSHKGAMGLMQLMPGTAKDMGVTDPFSPEQNLEAGVKYLSKLNRRYQGDWEKTLAAYNAGPSNVKDGKLPPFDETQNYIKKVMNAYKKSLR